MTVVVAGLDDLRQIVAEEVGRIASFFSELTALSTGEAAAAPVPAMLTADEVAEVLRIDIRELRRLIKERRFPPPVRLGARRVRWPRATVEAAIKGPESL